MSRSKAIRAGWVLAEALLVLSGMAGLAAWAQARALSTGPSRGDSLSGAGASGGQIDQVRLGFGLDLEGRVSPGCSASRFAMRDPIHFSVRVVDARAGSVVRASVRDAITHRVAWSEERPVPPGRSYVTFEIGRELAEGRYLAESALGQEGSTPQEFAVHVRNGDGR